MTVLVVSSFYAFFFEQKPVQFILYPPPRKCSWGHSVNQIRQLLIIVIFLFQRTSLPHWLSYFLQDFFLIEYFLLFMLE